MPKAKAADSNYGVILIPRASGSPDIGFGFALQLSQEDLRGANLELSGYLVSSAPWPEQTRYSRQEVELNYLHAQSGCCWVSQEGSLEYDMASAQGFGGSPIYVPYKGHETVVAIQ